MRASVVVLTYRRPQDLADALPVLVEHVEAVDDCELVIVDNDREPSARQMVEPWTRRHPVRYVHEPVPGIAAARNRGMDESSESDLVVFIDDDERPVAGWLAALIGTYSQHRCVGVVGPVVSVFATEIDPWIDAGRFFTRLRHATGTHVPVAATNNLLLNVGMLRQWGLRFDEEFGLTGGSDTVLSLEIAKQGGALIWCDEAVVHDVVPASRSTRDWVLRRAFRMGNTGSRANVHVTTGRANRLGVRVTMLGRGLARMGAGALRLTAGVVGRSVEHHARGSRSFARGLGMALGALGYVYSEYSRPAAVLTEPSASHG